MSTIRIPFVVEPNYAGWRLDRYLKEKIAEEAPWATLDHSVSFVPMRKEVQGFVQSPLGDFAFEGVDLAE